MMKRIFHPWDKWECIPAKMYDQLSPEQEPEKAYRDFLKDIPRFEMALQRVLDEWQISCEHFLSNENINRIAWLGQSSMCMDTGVPERFRAGFMLLSSEEKRIANATAKKYLDLWLSKRALDNSIQDPEEIESECKEQSGKIQEYVDIWKMRGYPDGIPEEVPNRLTQLNLAPSWKAIALAILKNDRPFKSLGFKINEPPI